MASRTWAWRFASVASLLRNAWIAADIGSPFLDAQNGTTKRMFLLRAAWARTMRIPGTSRNNPNSVQSEKQVTLRKIGNLRGPVVGTVGRECSRGASPTGASTAKVLHLIPEPAAEFLFIQPG